MVGDSPTASTKARLGEVGHGDRNDSSGSGMKSASLGDFVRDKPLLNPEDPSL